MKLIGVSNDNQKIEVDFSESACSINNKDLDVDKLRIDCIEIVSSKIHLFRSKIFLGYTKYFLKISLNSSDWFMTRDINKAQKFIEFFSKQDPKDNIIQVIDFISEGITYRFLIDKIDNIDIKTMLSKAKDNYAKKTLVIIDGQGNEYVYDVLSDKYGYEQLRKIYNNWNKPIHIRKDFLWDGISPYISLIVLSIFNFICIAFIPMLGLILSLPCQIYLIVAFEDDAYIQNFINVIVMNNMMCADFIRRFIKLFSSTLLVFFLAFVFSPSKMEVMYSVIPFIFLFLCYFVIYLKKFKNN